jgi:hypothetical protein
MSKSEKRKLVTPIARAKKKKWKFEKKWTVMSGDPCSRTTMPSK